MDPPRCLSTPPSHRALAPPSCRLDAPRISSGNTAHRLLTPTPTSFGLHGAITDEGQFEAGQVKGLGLLTFADGTCGRPRQEGQWDGTRLIRRAKADDQVRQAQDAAVKAKASVRQK